ncbi:AbrB family transcriptional regulator [Salicibibacter halophilus]|uniref:AbrB family transcriptional regulator n=1 Tax=Salicibibacter halophilus TaxID=2502791 RepID=A0A514LK26_9BACI|nr:AbrB family transcriptional regulator [Salicibibacter halophilus]QDI92210.1 AbrB family transcriptional regulator [Salicibibacter halophilus]
MMKFYKVLFLAVALLVGGLFSSIGVPAGWLLGGLLTGIFYGLFIRAFDFSGWPFQMALALVGINIGLIMEPDLFQQLAQYLLPLFITLVLTLLTGLFLGILLDRWTSLDRQTAFFCTIPGGASEVIAISSDYGADQRIVASFHTARITMFVLIIPFGIGMIYGEGNEQAQAVTQMLPTALQVSFFGLIIVGSYVLNRFVSFPGGILIFSIAFGFLGSEFIVNIGEVPEYVSGIGQGLIGAMVGIRFERSTVVRLRSIGVASLKVLGLYLLCSLGVALLFFWLTPLSYLTSLLSTVPAGAAEMASTAVALQIEPTLVASLHIIRVISIFLVLPFLFKWLMKD